ncbi:hypothetical protein Tco_0042886 [Tanacetum coccineum]
MVMTRVMIKIRLLMTRRNLLRMIVEIIMGMQMVMTRVVIKIRLLMEPIEDDGGNCDGNGNVYGEDDDGGRKSTDSFPDKQVESTEQQSVDPSRKENVVEEEAFEIMCTPESFTQWLDENADLVLEVILTV